VERYSVLIAASAVKELEAIDRKADRRRIVRAIQALAEDPRGPGSEKLAGSEGRYRVRVGSYRVVYAVDDIKRIVDVVKIGHRREVYR
jgi:mRNA interferase RelE/StbE